MSHNYIKILNWFWYEVPYWPGYKSEYGITFLAIIDLCNKNDWRKTSVEYDRMINKIRCSKKLYYESIKWLAGSGLIEYKKGLNDNYPATFSVSAEVHLCTSTDTLQPLCDTSTVPSALPSIPKQLNQETTKQLNKSTPEPKPATVKDTAYPIAFEAFWKEYGKPSASKKAAYQEWIKLKPDEQQTATVVIPAYKNHQPEPRFRKDPERYLKLRTWENDFSTPAAINGITQPTIVTANRPQAQTTVR